MTIQEYKDALGQMIAILSEYDANDDALYGAQKMMDWAIQNAKDNLLECKLDITELEAGKRYAVSFDPYDVPLKKAVEWIAIYQNTVKDKDIKLILKFDSTQIEEVDEEDAK